MIFEMDIRRKYLFVLFSITKISILNRFMIEMIKSKQDHIITKDLIRTRQLEHSMLRFTRIFQMGKGQFERDEGSTEYSCVMSEGKNKTNKILKHEN